MRKIDLKIGNLISYNNTTQKVVEIHKKGVIHTTDLGSNYFTEYKYLEPVRLTSRFLIECGFEEEKRLWQNRNFKASLLLTDILEIKSLEVSDAWNTIEYVKVGLFALGKDLGVNIKFVHELQNFYYSFKKEDIQFKELSDLNKRRFNINTNIKQNKQ